MMKICGPLIVGKATKPSPNQAGFSQIYSSPVTISSEGEYNIQYYSTDNAGNNETQKTSKFYIDKTSPSIDILYPKNQKVNGTISIRWNVADNMDSSPKITIFYKKLN